MTWTERVANAKTELARLQEEIDERCFELYGIDGQDRGQIQRRLARASSSKVIAELDEGNGKGRAAAIDSATLVASLLSWTVGVAFGRFDLRCANGERPAPKEPEPFDTLPVCSPGMLVCSDGFPLETPPAGYAIRFARDGILVDDAGADRDLLAAIRQVFESIFTNPAGRWEEAADILGDRDPALRTWFARKFFDLHIRHYSKSRRKAPIYWQLTTATASYSAWIYYHRLTRDTLFRLLNDHIVPKIKHEERKLISLSQDSAPNPSARQRKEIDDQEGFVTELRAFREEIARVAPLLDPDLNDGVIINFAPLWRLVPQNRSWQKECKRIWNELVAGYYDWAHLAMHLWAERVVPKCADDRSLAIAHGLEQVFWETDDKGKWKPKSVSREVIDRLIEARTSAAVKSALNDLLQAPFPAVSSGSHRDVGRRRRSTSI